MAKTTKKMYKELVNNGYASKGESLSDAEIKKLYGAMEQDFAAMKGEDSMKTNTGTVTVEETVDKLLQDVTVACHMEDSTRRVYVLGDGNILYKERDTLKIIDNTDVDIIDFLDQGFVLTQVNDIEIAVLNHALNNMTPSEQRKRVINLANKEYDIILTPSEQRTGTINSNKEEITMKKETLATRTLNMSKTERLVYVWDAILHVTKTTDELYIKKDELVQFLFDNDIISRMPGKNEMKRTKRQEFVDILDTVVQNLIKTKVIIPINGVPVGDLEITNDNAPEEVIEEQNTGTVRSIIATCCNVQWRNANQKAKNYISDFMLESCINRALHGKWTKDLVTHKDNMFTNAEQEATKEMKDKLLAGPYFIPYKEKGYIINANYVAWFYETYLGKHVVYRFTFKDKAKGYVDYKIDRSNKVVINLKNNTTTPFDENTWSKINKTTNFNRVVD